MKAMILPEHLLLLAMNDDEGTVVPSSAMALPYALNGALLMELSVRRRVMVDETVLRPVREDFTGDEILDEALQSLKDCDRERSAEYWVARPDSLVRHLQQKVQDRLVERGILQREEHKFLWLIPYDRFPQLDGRPERDLRQHIRDAVFHGEDPDESTALLISLIDACGLAHEVFSEWDPAEVKEKLTAFTQGAQIAKAIADDVAAATNAAVCTMLMTSVIPSMHQP